MDLVQTQAALFFNSLEFPLRMFPSKDWLFMFKRHAYWQGVCYH